MKEKKSVNVKLIVAIVLLLVVAVFAVLVFTKVIKIPTSNNVEETTESTVETDDKYLQDVEFKNETQIPYLQTEIKGLYYTMDKNGAVKFYSLANGVFTEQKASGTKEITVTMSESEITATVSYYEKDGKTVGYGLYTPPADEYALYQYAMFHLMNYGENCEFKSSNSCILAIDTTADDMYNDNKVYEEPFEYNFSDNSTSRLLSEANRTVGIDGTKRSDYSMINFPTVKYQKNHQLFFSGRQYAEDDTTVDLLRSGGEGNNTDNINLVKNVLGYYAAYNDNGDIRYVGVDENGTAGVFEYNPGKEESTAIKMLDNTKAADVLVSGDYVYSKATNVVVNILTGKTFSLKPTSSKITAVSFATDGKTAVVKGYVDGTTPTVCIYKLEDGSLQHEYTNNVFANAVNIHFTFEGKVAMTIAGTDKFTNYIFK